ncbi:MAG: RES domain-containing protein [Gemmatimonadaceae bacterium]
MPTGAGRDAQSRREVAPHIYDLVSVEITVRSHALDFTDPAVLRRFGVARDDLRVEAPGGYKTCRHLADIARALECFVLFVPSAPLDDGRNIVVFSDVLPESCSLRDGTVRVPLP